MMGIKLRCKIMKSESIALLKKLFVTLVVVSCYTEASTTKAAAQATIANPDDAIQGNAVVGVSCNTETSTVKAVDQITVANPDDAIQVISLSNSTAIL